MVLYPWNFSEIIDTEASAERFIRRMTNKCTYLPAEDVLPKNSLLYGKFMVLDELNNLRLNGEPISVELKQAIYQDVFKRYRKVTQKKLLAYLIREGIAGRETDITGIDGDFKSSLTAYHDFKEKLSGIELSPSEKETIILNITLFGEDKKLLQKRLKKLFPDMTEKQRIAVSNLSYKGWGRLSGKFLEGITAPDPETGEVRKRQTAQGYADESAWARGQAWAIYGYTMCYRYTHDQKYLDMAEKIYNFIFNNPNLPEDLVPYWDFDAPNIPNEPRDASAAACTASALYELSTYIPGKNYKETADKIMESLGSPAYRAEVGTNGNFILMHSVGSIPHGAEIDVPLNYADYYFLEGIMRKRDLEK